MIDILLPTYNGEKYLSQQLDSLLAQTVSDWRLLIRDDGSTDNTVQIIKEYSSEYKDKIVFIEDSLEKQGTSGSNNILLSLVSSEYFMFCDQDDIWIDTKIEESLNEMKKRENEYPNTPIIICSDACCIDENNKVLSESFFRSQKFFDFNMDFHRILALNVAQGSTMLMNYSVKNLVKRIPSKLFHDWWLAVNVALYGKIFYIHKPLLKYRQHRSNVVGALKIGPKYLLKKILNPLLMNTIRSRQKSPMPMVTSALGEP